MQNYFSYIKDTWKLFIILLSLSRVGNVRLAGWAPRDPSHLLLETLSDVASSRSQWRPCTFSLALSSQRSFDHLSLNFSP